MMQGTSPAGSQPTEWSWGTSARTAAKALPRTPSARARWLAATSAIDAIALPIDASAVVHARSFSRNPVPRQGPLRLLDGTAPIDASSGDQIRHRLSRAGNRQINRVLHIMAVVQLRNPTEGRACYDRKVAAGKTPREAMRALNRRLSDVVYHQMITDSRARATGPGGHVGAATSSSAAGSPQADRLPRERTNRSWPLAA